MAAVTLGGRDLHGEQARDARVAQLAERAARGERIKYLHFWGHRPRRDGTPGRGCLSQWWPAPFTVDGVTYASAEHWMMAGKARLFGDAEAERAAMSATGPAAAKKAGRLVRGFDEETWQRHRYEIVLAGSVPKFGQHDDLRSHLLGTGDRVLVTVTSAACGRGQSAGPDMGPWAGRRR